MRLSCNGCRVLRKGCSENCSIRPCLEWIKCPESQANATVFLAKFYGRAGLMNLINVGPAHLRPAIFRSLLYEACGRIVNPIYGSVGLMWSGSWHLCQNAVEAVLNGAPITQIATDVAEAKKGPPYKASDIRHVNKGDNSSGSSDLHRVRTRCRYKRTASKTKRSRVWIGSVDGSRNEDVHRSPSHESSLSHQSGTTEPVLERASRQSESLGSAETPESEAGLVIGVEPNFCSDQRLSDDDEIELDLTLGFEPIKRCAKPKELKRNEASRLADDGGLCRMELGLDYPS